MNNIPQQCNTKYHKLLRGIRDLKDYEDISVARLGLAILLREIYEEHVKLRKQSNMGEHHGIYYVYRNDFGVKITGDVTFSTEKERDMVFEDWQKGLYWDNEFNIELPYKRPYDDGLPGNPAYTLQKTYKGKILMDIEDDKS